MMSAPNTMQEGTTLVDIGNCESGNKLVERELVHIFANACISTKDLLNFRFVNRAWRDAATSVLLQKNSCHFVLSKTWIPSSEFDDSNINQAFCNARNNNALLEDLMKLMSTSPKFPSSHLRVIDYPEEDIIGDAQELLEFLAFFGNNLKTFHTKCLSRKQLCDILNTYAPNLETLEMPHCIIFPEHDDDGEVAGPGPGSGSGSGPGVEKLSATNKIKTLRQGHWFDKTEPHHSAFFKDLLRSSVNLERIENANIKDLATILQENKGHLVTDLKCDFGLFVDSDLDNEADKEDISVLKKFAALPNPRPGLSKITLVYSYLHKNPRVFAALVAGVNSVLKSNKTSLKHLEIFVNPLNFTTRLHIPSMPNLKCVRLNESHFNTGNNTLTENQRQEGGAGGAGKETEPDYVFKFEDDVPTEEYFPSLNKVELNIRNYNIDDTLMRFYAFNSSSSSFSNPLIMDGDVIPKVETLEIFSFVWPDPADAKLMSHLFPNIRVLKIKCDDARGFKNSIWTLCPLAEFVEIYGVSTGVCAEEVEMVDKFFTGFPLEICVKLRSTKLPLVLENCEESMRFLRVAPSLCDLGRLKELKIKFANLWGQFASDVSGVYAFLKMPDTKIIFSYNPATARSDQAQYIESYLDYVEPYVQVLQEK